MEQYERVLLSMAEDKRYCGENYPLRFIEIMGKNKGGIAALSLFGPDEDGLERRNPVIVAMGDSVTAGRFQWLYSPEEIEKNYMRLLARDFEQAILDVEAADVLHSYPEIFRRYLIENYQYTCVSVINAGIAGDTMRGMYARHERDIIKHDPDLVLINGALNWDENVGTAGDFYWLLKKMVRNIKEKTRADIILITPNGMAGTTLARSRVLEECVEKIRAIASEEKICLADIYALWKDYKAMGYSWEPLLANGLNHPVKAGHDAYAKVLMNLCKKG